MPARTTLVSIDSHWNVAMYSDEITFLQNQTLSKYFRSPWWPLSRCYYIDKISFCYILNEQFHAISIDISARVLIHVCYSNLLNPFTKNICSDLFCDSYSDYFCRSRIYASWLQPMNVLEYYEWIIESFIWDSFKITKKNLIIFHKKLPHYMIC